MDPRCTPSRILRNHPEDQGTNLFRDSLSAGAAANPRENAPIEAEPSSVPANHGLRRDDDEGLLPTGPSPTSRYPEQPVEWSEPWSWVSMLQHRDLLAERQIRQEKASTTAEDANESA